MGTQIVKSNGRENAISQYKNRRRVYREINHNAIDVVYKKTVAVRKRHNFGAIFINIITV